MSSQYGTPSSPSQEVAFVSETVATQLASRLRPLLLSLDRLIDARLVRTFLRTMAVVITCRTRGQGLLLTELGAFLTSPQRAPAGTKRLSDLLRCCQWGARIIEAFLWERADQQLENLGQQGEQALCMWDGSGLEKAESAKLEGLCPVRGS
jgi:hypothetical protein